MSVACRCTFLDSSSSDDLKLAEGLSEDLEKSEIECISNYIELYQSYSFHVSCVGPLACSMSQLTHQQHHCRATTNGGSGAVGHTASSLITIRQQQKLSRLLSLPMPCAHRYSGIPEQGICLPFTLHSTSVVLPTFVPHSHIPTRSSGQVHKSNPFPIHLSVLPTHSNGRCRWSRRPPRASQPASHQDQINPSPSFPIQGVADSYCCGVMRLSHHLRNIGVFMSEQEKVQGGGTGGDKNNSSREEFPNQYPLSGFLFSPGSFQHCPLYFFISNSTSRGS